MEDVYCFRGIIRFRNGAPSYIHDGSTLTVTIKDTSRTSASSLLLGKFVQEIKDYNDGDVFKYQMNMEGRPKAGYPLTLTAILNVNHPNTPRYESEAPRSGDWLNDRTHQVKIQENVFEYKMDIEVACKK